MADAVTMLDCDSKSPVFIGGQRCSGMRELGAILDRYTEISCGPPLKFPQRASFLKWHQTLTSEWSERIEKFGFEHNVMDRSFAALIDNLLTRAQCATGKSRWAERSPGNILSIDYLLRLFPHAQFIHVIRDPRDTFSEIKEHSAMERPNWGKFASEVAAPVWVRCVETGVRWRSQSSRYIEVRYEQLAAQPEPILQQVLEFLHEPWNDDLSACVLPGDDGTRRKDQQTEFHAAVGRWQRDLSPEEVRAVEGTAGRKMVEFGYSLHHT